MSFPFSDSVRSLLSESGIFLSEQEITDLELADFGLNDFRNIGLIVHTYVNTDRCCAKELLLLPGQTCPEHRHPPLGPEEPGKEETFRCRYGSVSVFLPGPVTAAPVVTAPDTGREFYSVFCEHVLRQGDSLTLKPDTRHWFRAHDTGAVVSEFSSHSDDDSDIFSDPGIDRTSRYS